MIEKLRNYKIAVLAGGPSSEREISLKSGKAVHDALLSSGLDPLFVDIHEEDEFIAMLGRTKIDIAFIALHGKFGEDGTVQRILEEEKVRYTGSGPEASHIALDKIASKEIFVKENILTPEYKVFEKGVSFPADDIWCPCVIKPGDEGSSIGLTIVNEKEAVRKAFEEASKYCDEIVIERFIPGREMTVGILDDEPLPVVEIVTESGIYDFDAKYRSSGTKYLAPAEIDDKLRLKAQEVCVAAHKVLECSGFSRVDIRVTDDDEVYVLEVNTIPGLTERSLLPMAAKAAGMDFEELCLAILHNALSK